MSNPRKGEYDVTPEQYCDDDGEPANDRDYGIVVRRTGDKTLFGQLPECEFPASTWLADVLRDSVRPLDLDSRALRRPSPPNRRRDLMADGSGLPWMVAALADRSPEAYYEWLTHLRTILPDLSSVEVVERPEDKHRYLVVAFANGLRVPSWMVSDGTLRALALTLVPFNSDEGDLWLIEEPEISIHPLNLEAVMQSLQSVYEGQVLVATHSPAVVALAEPADILVFEMDENSQTSIVRGDEHRGLKDWRHEVDLGTLFAGGVLG